MRTHQALTAVLLGATLMLTACGGEDTDVTAAPITDVQTGQDGSGDGAEVPTPQRGNDPAVPADSRDAPQDDAPQDDAPQGVAPQDEDRPDHIGSDPGGFRVEPEGQELALVGNDTVEVLYTLDPAGESFFVSAAVMPGSTRQDMTVVTISQAEGMYELRWLEVSGGQVGELEAFPAAYQLIADVVAYEGVAPTVVWSPDAKSVGWFDPGDDEAVLRTVGWSDGPGTGRPADDNASWGIEQAPAVLQARAWEVAHSDGSQTILTAEDAEGASYRLHLERQGDGALAYHGLAG